MRRVISKDKAIRDVVLIIALILILLIYPVRLFTTTLETTGGGTIVSESEAINFENPNLTQEFIAQYDRLSSVSVYVTGVETGRYLAALLYDEKGEVMLTVYVDTEEYDIPGYVDIPMEINLEVGHKYALRLRDCRSKYRVAFENVPDTPAYVGSLTRNYENIEGLHLAAVYNYRLPISKKISMSLISGIVFAALCIIFGSRAYYKKYPDKNNILTVGMTVKFVANPIAVVIFGALMIMVFPLKLFDSRVVDILFYELGIIITAAIVFYAINHKAVKHQEGISFWQSLKSEDRLHYVLVMLAMAMAIWYACEYMNGLADIFHDISERKMTFWLLVVMVLTFTKEESLNPGNLIWIIASGIYGGYYYSINRLLDSEKEYDLHNTVLKFTVFNLILFGLIIISFIRRLIRLLKVKEKEDAKKRAGIYPTVFGALLLILFILMIVFRNTRLWGIYLAVVFTCFFIRLALWDKKKDYYNILSGAFMLNFAISLVYCYLHRYFAGYVSGRFGFLFHTVTVTAEYFTFMGGAAAILLLVKIMSLPKKTAFKEAFKVAWKEMIFFGFTMSYAIFTVSRTGYLAIISSLIIVICIAFIHEKRRIGAVLAGMVLSVAVSFPAAFTLQRMIPTIVADPVFYAIDDADSFVRGGADWDNTNFMCVERFINLFESKILGMEVGTYDYPIDKYNYENEGKGPLIYDDYGYPVEEGKGIADPAYSRYLLASSTITGAELTILYDETADYVDTSNPIDVISNGRITIFRSYIKELNMTGHEGMGVLLPNGEISIHAHNTYIQVAFDNGIIVGILFVIVLIAGLICSVRRYTKDCGTQGLCLISCAVIIGFMVAGISEWVFHYCNPMTVALMLSVAPLTFRVGVR